MNVRKKMATWTVNLFKNASAASSLPAPLVSILLLKITSFHIFPSRIAAGPRCLFAARMFVSARRSVADNTGFCLPTLAARSQEFQAENAPRRYRQTDEG